MVIFRQAPCALLLIGAMVWGQVPSGLPRFEVASVKPSSGDFVPSGPGKYSRATITEDRVTLSGIPLKQMIQMAFDVKPFQVVGPAWMETTNFDVLATIPADTGKERVPEMLQTFLAERFGLVVHRRASDQPVFGLMVSKSGLKLRESDTSGAVIEGNGHVELAHGDRQFSGMAISSDTPFGPMKMSMDNGILHYEYPQMTMAGLAQFLTGGVMLLGLPVVDMTGLTGHYQVLLDISGADMLAGSRAPVPAGGDDSALTDPPGRSVFSSIEKLGLRLEKTKAPIEEIVIDRVAKVPTGN
jgi:uncharacterized protein (TIGR03435 family)